MADDGLVVRLGVSSREIEGPLAAMRRRLGFAALVAVAAALVLGLFASRLASRPLRTMAQQAGRIAQGDYDVRFPPLPKDEFGHLADTLAALAQQLSADMERIGKLERTRRDFVANVAHELRTPVAAMQGLAETLQQDELPPEQGRRFAELLHRQAQRLSGLVSSLLRLAELEGADTEKPELAPVRVRAVAAHVEETLRALARESGVRVELDVDDALVASADADRLEQVLVNLVDNAIKYGRLGGRVMIAAKRDGGAVVLTVADDGDGIDAEHLPRMFERFYRVDVGRSREKGGAGLGLAIVKHLVESMGGTVVVESERERGTTFRVTLRDASDGPVGADVTRV